MNHSTSFGNLRRLSALGIVLLVAFALSTVVTQPPVLPTTGLTMQRAVGAGSGASSAAGHAATGLGTTQVGNTLVSASVAPLQSRALRDMKPQAKGSTLRHMEREQISAPVTGHTDVADAVAQRTFGLPGSRTTPAMPAPIQTWEGISLNDGSGIPPDTNGAVGPTQYVQMINSSLQVWNKSGTTLAGPVTINSLWSGSSDACALNNDGDPIVLYDRQADRWLVSQFTASAPYAECIAISTTGDAAGSYYAYTFVLSNTAFEDYPHFGIWPDGYYMSMNEFVNNSNTGPRPFVFDRTKMLTGQTATFQTVAAVQSAIGVMLPSDLDGTSLPPAGAPNYFVAGIGSLQVYRYHVDWANPAATSFTLAGTLPVAGFTRLCPQQRSCLPQPDTTARLDGLGDRLMFRLAYRNLGGVERLVVNNSVNVSNYAGVRWYEIRNPSTTPSIYQQGTYAPADGNHRWGASVAQDRDGNTALAYTIVGSTVYPGIRYTGRLAGDPLNTMPQSETTLVDGSGSQVVQGGTVTRWGDYSALTLDPTDDCTFWYTSEYFQTTGQIWQTRIGAFRFPTCSGTPPPTPTPVGPPPTPTVGPGCLFSDVCQSDYFYTPVQYLVSHGAISGYSDNTFRPYTNATRQQLCKIIVNAEGWSINTTNGPHFNDVAPGSTFYNVIETAYNHGIISGYTDGTFRPAANITRAQLSKIIVGAQAWTVNTTGGPHFSDVAPGTTFYNAIETAVNHNIISGYNDGTFRPSTNATRGQISKIIYGALTAPLR